MAKNDADKAKDIDAAAEVAAAPVEPVEEAAADEAPQVMPADALLQAATDMHACMAEFIAAAEFHTRTAAKEMDMAAHVRFSNIALAFANFRTKLAAELDAIKSV